LDPCDLIVLILRSVKDVGVNSRVDYIGHVDSSRISGDIGGNSCCKLWFSGYRYVSSNRRISTRIDPF
jgi:hypothetical protein